MLFDTSTATFRTVLYARSGILLSYCYFYIMFYLLLVNISVHISDDDIFATVKSYPYVRIDWYVMI